MYCIVIQYMQLHIHSFTGDFFQDSNEKLEINKQQRKKTPRKEKKTPQEKPCKEKEFCFKNYVPCKKEESLIKGGYFLRNTRTWKKRFSSEILKTSLSITDGNELYTICMVLYEDQKPVLWIRISMDPH